jgi:hypothetical protein
MPWLSRVKRWLFSPQGEDKTRQLALGQSEVGSEERGWGLLVFGPLVCKFWVQAVRLSRVAALISPSLRFQRASRGRVDRGASNVR